MRVGLQLLAPEFILDMDGLYGAPEVGFLSMSFGSATGLVCSEVAFGRRVIVEYVSNEGG